MDASQVIGLGARIGALSSGSLANDLSGATITNQAQVAEAERDRAFNQQMAQDQREHELYMSNTAYQRAVEDMKKAGINPATLSGLVSGGSPASAPSSSAASSSGMARFSHASKNEIVGLITGLVNTATKAGVSIGASAMSK